MEPKTVGSSHRCVITLAVGGNLGKGECGTPAGGVVPGCEEVPAPELPVPADTSLDQQFLPRPPPHIFSSSAEAGAGASLEGGVPAEAAVVDANSSTTTSSCSSSSDGSKILSLGD